MAAMTRRRFLAALLAAAGVGGAGMLAWLRRPEETAAVATTSPTTSPPPSSAVTSRTAAPARTEPNLPGGEANLPGGEANLPGGEANLPGGEATSTTTAPATTSPTTTTSTTVEPTTTTTTTTSAPTTTTSTTTTTTSTTAAPTAGLTAICREAWGALPVAGEFRRHTIEHITVHHTAVVLADNRDAPGRVRQHQQFHQSRGWPDLAYHFIIDAAGYIYEGRPIDAVGDTGTDYDPTGHFLVCCEGDFNQQQVTPAQYASLVQMLAWGAAEFGIDPQAIVGHRDVAATSCPGDDLYRSVADGSLAADVAAATVQPLRTVCGAEGEALVAAIEG